MTRPKQDGPAIIIPRQNECWLAQLCGLVSGLLIGGAVGYRGSARGGGCSWVARGREVQSSAPLATTRGKISVRPQSERRRGPRERWCGRCVSDLEAPYWT